jgi:DNA repair ATPase RecN
MNGAAQSNLRAKPDVTERTQMSQVSPPTGSVAVAKMFEPTRVFEERLSKLLTAFDQVDRLGKDATNAFELVSELAEHLGQFAQAYAPVKTFHGEVTVLAQKFDPLKAIQSQLTEMSRSFGDHLNYLVKVLEPASKIQERLAQLAKAFEPAANLKERFQLLAREFEVLSSPASSAAPAPPLNDSAKILQDAVAQRLMNT